MARSALARGIVDGKYVERAPLPLSRELFAVGHFGYDTYCAACHGLDGSGAPPSPTTWSCASRRRSSPTR